MKITINDYTSRKCSTFAKERIKTSAGLYKYRGETNMDKMVEDVKIGTMAEYAVFNYVKQLGFKCTKPDLKHYKAKDKSFSADLKADKVFVDEKTLEWRDALIHVKSQGTKSAKAYGSSWLFQKQDKIFRGEKDEEFLAFCIVDKRDVELQAIVKVKDVKKLLKEPKVWRYKDTKVALYLDDVLENVTELWRIK